jgi:hypothetical protein
VEGIFLAALFAVPVPMTDEQLALYGKHTGRNLPPSNPLDEAWLVCGRRRNRSFILAVIAVFLACFKDWRPFKYRHVLMPAFATLCLAFTATAAATADPFSLKSTTFEDGKPASPHRRTEQLPYPGDADERVAD